MWHPAATVLPLVLQPSTGAFVLEVDQMLREGKGPGPKYTYCFSNYGSQAALCVILSVKGRVA